MNADLKFVETHAVYKEKRMNRWTIALGLIALLAVVGCASEERSDRSGSAVSADNTGAVLPSESGTITFSIQWPAHPSLADRTHPSLINPATQWFRVRMKETSGFTAFADVLWSMITASLTVPIGDYAIHALAFNRTQPPENPFPSPVLLSFGTTTAHILGGQTVTANITLNPVSLVFNQPTSFTYGASATLELLFANWPPDVYKAKIDLYVFDPVAYAVFQPLCTMGADSSATTVRSCTANPLPASGPTNLNVLVIIDGSAYTRDFGSGPTLYPSGATENRVTYFSVLSGSIPAN